MIIAGECTDWTIAFEIEDIVRTSLISFRMRELSQQQKHIQTVLF